MKAEYQDFIGIYTDVFPEGFCEFVISEFENAYNSGAGLSRLETEGAHSHRKSDVSMLGSDLHNLFTKTNEKPSTEFFHGLQACYKDYVIQHSSLSECRILATEMKLQKTAPGEGYHIWHFEQSDPAPRRVLTYILYLNTLELHEAGETEFLYQQRRIRPVRNTLVIWPASYTHTHRGNTVFGTNKYVATGWFNITG
jgi:hypothetical protein